MDKKPVYVLFGIGLLSVVAHYYIYSENKIERLESVIEYSDRAREIADDQIRDLMYELKAAKSENEMVATRNYVSGVVETIKRPEHFDQIWHDGYDRGTEVQIMASKVEKEIELVNEKETK